MTQQGRSGVFISHAHEDGELAESLAALLKSAMGLTAAEITCTSDAEFGLEFGDDVKGQITSRLANAQALFLLATPASRERDWVHYECALADGARGRGEKLHFYVVVPTGASFEHAVPAPYVGYLAVTLSHAREVRQFIKQVASDLQRGTGTVDLDAFASIVDQAQRLEVTELAKKHEVAASVRMAALERQEEQRAVQAEHLRLRARWLSIAAAVLLASTVGVWAWQQRDADRYREERERLSTQYAEALREKDDELSQRAAEAQQRADEDFRSFAFTGLVLDSQHRSVGCTSVEATLADGRSLPKRCDGAGTFRFSAAELKNDARYPISLRVHVRNRFYEPPEVHLTNAALAVVLRVPAQ